MKEIEEKATFICGHRKSGTTMLLGLLDNHPELLVYPPDSAFFYGYYPRYTDQAYTDEQRIGRMSGFIADQLEKELDNLSVSDRADLNFNMQEFRRDIVCNIEGSDMSPRAMLIGLLKAYGNHFDGSKKARRWLEKTTSTEIYAAEVMQWFPDAKFIHLIRDPRDNWASLKSGWLKRYQNYNDELKRLLQSMIDRGKLGMEFAKNNAVRFGPERYHVIRFEDITTRPKKILEGVCDFLEISFDESLLVPTVCGKLWRGNNFDGLSFDKPSNVNVGRWPERIEPEEAMLIEYYFGDLMEHFDYELKFLLAERMDAATRHYKWYNFAQLYSAETTEQKAASST